jgi:hypothetical protein
MLDEIKKYITLTAYWPILSFIILLIGYLTFYFYSTTQNIPFAQPTLTLIIGLGLFVSLVTATAIIVGFYSSETPDLNSAISISLFVVSLTNRPDAIAIAIIIFLTWAYYKNLFNLKFNGKKFQNFFTRFFSNFFFPLLALSYGIFIDGSILFLFPLFYLIILTTYKSKDSFNKLLLSIFLSLLLTSVILSSTILKNVSYTFFGLTRVKADVTLNEDIHKTGIIKFQDASFIYLEDSIQQTILLPQSRVISIVKLKEDFKRKSLLDETKDLFHLVVDSSASLKR